MWPASHGQSSWRAHSRAHGDCETRGLPGFSSPLRFSTCPISLFSISSSELLEDQEQPKPGTKLVLQSTARAVVCLSQCKGSWASSSQGSSQSGTHSSGSSPIWKCGSAEQTSPLPARSGFGFSFPGLQDLLLLLISLDGSIPRGAKGTWQVT